MQKPPPQQIELPPEVTGYIQGYKDMLAAQAEMIAQRSANVFGLRAQLAAAHRQLAEKERAQAAIDALNAERGA